LGNGISRTSELASDNQNRTPTINTDSRASTLLHF